MKKPLAILIALFGLFAVITQFYLMRKNAIMPLEEVVIRFFSFFTILTNTIVAIHFTIRSVIRKELTLKTRQREAFNDTAITVYISVVGLVYQLLLRQVWNPTGMQKLVDELLHSIIPVLTILYWFLYTEKEPLTYLRSLRWLIFPLVYLIFIILRGHASGFYPYPFINVQELGMKQTLQNSLGLTVVFLGMSALYVSLGSWLTKKQEEKRRRQK